MKSSKLKINSYKIKKKTNKKLNNSKFKYNNSVDIDTLEYNIINLNIGGGLIISAPHSIYVRRMKTIHLPEKNIKKIALKIQNIIGLKTVSSITWDIKADKNNIIFDDPNYIPIKKLENNIWYKYLNILINELIVNKKKKLFLIDIHGMSNQYKFDIIFGLNSIRKNISELKFKKVLKCLIDIFEEFKNKYGLRIGYNIIFTGYGKKNILTVCQMATKLDIPAIQIEMSDKFRSNIVKKSSIAKDYINCINKFYKCYYKL